MSMKKIILMSLLLFSFNGWAEDIIVEHYSSDQTIKQGFPFSDAVRVDNTIYISGILEKMMKAIWLKAVSFQKLIL